MRISFLLIAVVAFYSCKAQIPPSLSKEESQQYIEPSHIKEIRYKRQTRGYNSLLSIDSKKMVLSYANKKSQTYSYPRKEWDSLVYLASRIKLSDLPNLKAPTSHRMYDGAAAAELTMVVDQKSWVSSTFDDGYPPDEISELVNRLLSLEKAVLKKP
jgi:hypothetical protein